MTRYYIYLAGKNIMRKFAQFLSWRTMLPMTTISAYLSKANMLSLLCYVNVYC